MSTFIIGIAAESEGDARIVEALLDRMLIEGIDWVAETFEACRGAMDDGLAPCRSFWGAGGSRWLDLHRARRLARERGLRIYGHFGGETREDDAQMHRAALFLFAEEDEPPKSVVIARDLDREPGRAAGFAQAVGSSAWPFVVIGALAEPEIEAWLIAAWIPEDNIERARFDDLGFDPCSAGERLTSKKSSDPRDAKRILEVLTTTGRDALARWNDVPIAHLESKGERSGLGDFVRDVRARLLPAVRRGS